MIKHSIIIVCVLFFGVSQVAAQFKTLPPASTQTERPVLNPLYIPSQSPVDVDKQIPLQFNTMDLSLLEQVETRIFPRSFDDNGLPIFFKGSLNEQQGMSLDQQVEVYMREIARYYDYDLSDRFYVINKMNVDQIGMTHIEVQQLVNGHKLEDGFWKLHAKDGLIVKANGRLVEVVETISETSHITAAEAHTVVQNALKKEGIFQKIEGRDKMLIPGEQFSSELLVSKIDGRYQLVYKVDSYASISKRMMYYVDANTGAILSSYKNYCSLHGYAHDHDEEHNLPPDGPASGSGLDLGNTNRTINTYEVDGTFYLIDAAREQVNGSPLLQSSSVMPNEPVGVLWTIDAFNTNPQNDDFSYDHVTSSSASWNNKTAVSAHYNSGIAYEYFKNTHERNSINGQGGNIISLINISDPETGGGFDNAFWNGAAMFYGNGNTAFEPLARALDVAGHEMSHGVIQATANLTYQGESGAMNESFADIFGAMMDKEDWFLGEDVTKTSFIASGRLRDMSNPHNGGNSLNDRGWQPDNVSEQFTGSADNGGVHINSGIVNHAYYLFATSAGVGSDKAEQVYYKALTEYLFASSNFKDLRVAVEQSSMDLYGASVRDAASAAFTSVGIGTGGGQDYETDVEVNPGADFLLHADAQLSNLILRDNDLNIIADPLSQIDPISRPSVTDNGEEIFYVGSDNNIYNISIDWDALQFSINTFSDAGVWRNVAISKDGRRLAALSTSNNNIIIVLDFSKPDQTDYELFNPTFTQGVTTGDVNFADAMEFDFTGEWIMYDAQSTIEGNSGSIEYWDIGFLNVYNNASNTYGSGQIQKLFSQLPDNTNVGNPTFSKNSPHIIAFDQITSSNYYIVGANLQSGASSQIFENGGLGYPSFNSTDQQIVYEFSSFFGTDIGLSELDDTKINSVFNSETIIVENARFPVVFSNGERTIVDQVETEEEIEVKVYPNPTAASLHVELGGQKASKIMVYDQKGAMIIDRAVDSEDIILDVHHLSTGVYQLQIQVEGRVITRKFTRI